MDNEGCTPESLFRLNFRVIWLYQPLPRFRFRSPQSASITLIRPRTAVPTGGEAVVPALSALEKFVLVTESDERCYWCGREFGSRWSVKGRIRRLRLEWDHVIPQSQDGAGDVDNMVPSCNICNGWKSDRVFDTEAEIRVFLEDQWEKTLSVPTVAEDSPPDPVTAAGPEAIAVEPVLIEPGERPMVKVRAHIPKPKPEPGDLGQRSSRQPPRGVRVKVHGGPMHNHRGTTDGPSRDRPQWTRVLMGALLVPWRFDPRSLEVIVEDEQEAA